ncbi:hypothetical protein ACG5V6_12455 [Streptomyces chitinivorans]|uniref:Uncharacterized protein n=1 Tax=Streptomyces chitinivorans TaxID=1257027 RepID=A0ABW7HT00_9ACTN|nr:hypothetical protein [Streptomyces chitinivorans]MDH2409626.1 hypothetical protein [Streptomyces chitinivorans]
MNCGADFLVPDDHSKDALGRLAADCTLPAGHSGDHSNGLAVWAAEAQFPACDAEHPDADNDWSEAAADCVKSAGHPGAHDNGLAQWTDVAPDVPSRADLLILMLPRLSDRMHDITAGALRWAEGRLPATATDAEILAEAGRILRMIKEGTWT